ncbi:MAG: DNA polymerase III subunit delta [Bacteroidota bacterium]
MSIVGWEEVFRNIKNKKYHPVYLLMGEEPFYIDVISKYIEDTILNEEEKEFNFSVLYGRETDAITVVSTAKRFPMLSEYQVVIVKEAQNMKDIEKLESYIKNPLDSTILVICYKYKSFDKRKTFVKAVMQKGVVMESKKVYDNRMPGWIQEYLKRHGYKIDPRSAQLLADHLGNDLSKVVNELKKLFISLPKGSTITTDIIEKNIGISKDFNVFELQDALTTKNSLKAFQIVKYFSENPKTNPLVVTLSVLNSFFTKILIYHSISDKTPGNVASKLGMPPFLVQGIQKAAQNYRLEKLYAIFAYLREYDVRSKGVNNQSTSHGDLLKELVYKILT